MRPLAFFATVLFLFALTACGLVSVDGEVLDPNAGTATRAPAPVLTATPLPTDQPLPPAPTNTAPGQVLPAPLYFINGLDQQIWRVERDGVSLRKITNEPHPITFFAVSPVDSAVAYISHNTLYRADAFGANRLLLFAGVELEANDYARQINEGLTNPHWLPDGSKIVFGLNGVNIIPADGSGAYIQLLGNTPFPTTPPAREDQLKLYFFRPQSISPDGKWILTFRQFYNEGAELWLVPVDGNSYPRTLDNPNGPECCDFRWAADSQSLYYAEPYPSGLHLLGLWRVEVNTYEFTRVAAGFNGPETQPTSYDLYGFPYAVNGGVLAFAATRAGDSDPTLPPFNLSLSTLAADGRLTPLRSDAYYLAEALYDPLGTGAVIVEFPTHFDGTSFAGPLRWLDTANSPAVDLQVTGSSVQWGK